MFSKEELIERIKNDEIETYEIVQLGKKIALDEDVLLHLYLNGYYVSDIEDKYPEISYKRNKYESIIDSVNGTKLGSLWFDIDILLPSLIYELYNERNESLKDRDSYKWISYRLVPGFNEIFEICKNGIPSDIKQKSEEVLKIKKGNETIEEQLYKLIKLSRQNLDYKMECIDEIVAEDRLRLDIINHENMSQAEESSFLSNLYDYKEVEYENRIYAYLVNQEKEKAKCLLEIVVENNSEMMIFYYEVILQMVNNKILDIETINEIDDSIKYIFQNFDNGNALKNLLPNSEIETIVTYLAKKIKSNEFNYKYDPIIALVNKIPYTEKNEYYEQKQQINKYMKNRK